MVYGMHVDGIHVGCKLRCDSGWYGMVCFFNPSQLPVKGWKLNFQFRLEKAKQKAKQSKAKEAMKKKKTKQKKSKEKTKQKKIKNKNEKQEKTKQNKYRKKKENKTKAKQSKNKNKNKKNAATKRLYLPPSLRASKKLISPGERVYCIKSRVLEMTQGV